MSQSRTDAAARARYRRSPGGMVAALIICVLLVGGYAALQSLKLGDKDVQTQSVDWKAMLRAGRSDGKLATLAPAGLPAGWRATSAGYQSGVSPTWHLGVLTAGGRYVGVDEARDSIEKIVGAKIDKNAERRSDVQAGGQTWQVWTDSGGDYALARTFTGPGKAPESVVVGGSAKPAQVRSFAVSLQD